MRTFEYLTMAIGTSGWFSGGKIDLEALNRRLNELGQEGWELVSTVDTNKNYGEPREVILFLKKERPGT